MFFNLLLTFWMTCLVSIAIATSSSHKGRVNDCRWAQAGESLIATIEKPGETHCIYSRDKFVARSRNAMRKEVAGGN